MISGGQPPGEHEPIEAEYLGLRAQDAVLDEANIVDADVVDEHGRVVDAPNTNESAVRTEWAKRAWPDSTHRVWDDQ